MTCFCGAEFEVFEDWAAHYNAARVDDVCRRYNVAGPDSPHRCSSEHPRGGRCQRIAGHDEGSALIASPTHAVGKWRWP